MDNIAKSVSWLSPATANNLSFFYFVSVARRLPLSRRYASKSHINANNAPLILVRARVCVVVSDTSISLTWEAQGEGLSSEQ